MNEKTPRTWIEIDIFHPAFAGFNAKATDKLIFRDTEPGSNLEFIPVNSLKPGLALKSELQYINISINLKKIIHTFAC